MLRCYQAQLGVRAGDWPSAKLQCAAEHQLNTSCESSAKTLEPFVNPKPS